MIYHVIHNCLAVKHANFRYDISYGMVSKAKKPNASYFANASKSPEEIVSSRPLRCMGILVIYLEFSPSLKYALLIVIHLKVNPQNECQKVWVSPTYNKVFTVFFQLLKVLIWYLLETSFSLTNVCLIDVIELKFNGNIAVFCTRFSEKACYFLTSYSYRLVRPWISC